MRINSNAIYIILFFIIVLAVWLAFFAVPQPAGVNLEKKEGTANLAAMDFSNTVYYYQDFWENYAGRLYTPQDFAEGGTVPPVHMEHEDYEQVQYATHRMKMELVPGVTYAISMKSPDYAMRIFIDGEEFDSAGYPSDRAETTYPALP